MRRWVVDAPRPIGDGPLRLVERADPQPDAGRVRIRVTCCGVCRTDLHLAEGDLPPHRPRIAPGHEVVGRVDALGDGATGFGIGDRVGVPWLAGVCGTCRFCRSGRENLCTAPTFTGWDVHGGYAEYCVADARFVYRIPDGIADDAAAPLLCAGIIGYRALRQGMRVHVLTRGAANRALALRLGADSAGPAEGHPPEPLDGAILFAPAGELVPVALRALDRGGTLAVAGIWLSAIPALDYERELFGERRVCSVTANTRADGVEFLTLAERLGVRATTVGYPFEQADRALADLARGAFSGAAVLHL